MLAFEALRIAAGRPEITDVDERSLPHEFDWLASSVHLTKGCYRGQETVAKVHNLGHPPRRLIILNLEVGDTVANPGEEIFYQGKLVGKVLAGALHYEAGSLALGLVNRNTPYLDLQVCGMTASQRVLVPADAGKAANLPRPSAFKLSGKK
jgi:folate-binding protein YgfZ